ncbi:MAG: hypothetical protein ABWZ25_17285 [Chitinophagaceae bacterium]
MSEKKSFRSVQLRGIFYFIEDAIYSFKGPMRKGLRPIMWQTKIEGEATSFTQLSDAEIYPGEKREIKVVILNELQFEHPIIEYTILSAGTIGHGKINKFGEFEVLEHLGEWHGGRVP